ncbi:hypothetical protein BH23GEM9_BH23GEM9_15550 [soil metagenome]
MNYRVLLPHPLESRLLMMQREGTWRLPEWEEPASPSWWLTSHVNRAVAARFGMETTVLRCLRDGPTDDAGQRLRVYELDNHSAPHDMVPTGTWIGRAELDMLHITDADTRDLIEYWFRRDAGEIALRGSPWTVRGWYVEALAWAVAQLREHGAVITDPPEQLRTWERSFLMRISTDSGAFYFKAAPDINAYEPLLMEWLARRFPGNVPEIVAADPRRGWFIQRVSAGGALPLEQVREEEEWYRAIRRLGEIQLDCSRATGELRRLGVPYRGLDVLAHRIPELCSDAGALMPEGGGGLSPAEFDRVATLGPSLLALCEELASLDLPDSLEHGDLEPLSVLSSLGEPLYLDWSDSSISHPFFSPSMLMSAASALLPASSRETRRRLRDSYLAAWTDLIHHDRLDRAFEIARVLAPIHSATRIHAELLPIAGYVWEIQGAIPARMRSVLRLIAGDPDAAAPR